MSKAVASGIIQNEITVPAYGTGEVQYLDIYPNYFRVTNYGSGAVLCGLTKTPTDESYDFSCAAKSMKVFADVFARRYLYIYNPTGSPVRIKVDALFSEFDPLILALANIDLDFSGISMETSTEITGFKSALPAGTNHIGKVTVENQIDGSYLESLVLSTKTYELMRSGTATASGVSLQADSNYRINEIVFLSNDGTTDLTLQTIYNGTAQSIIVKSGEVINNMACYCDAVKVSGSSVPYRLVCTERLKV